MLLGWRWLSFKKPTSLVVGWLICDLRHLCYCIDHGYCLVPLEWGFLVVVFPCCGHLFVADCLDIPYLLDWLSVIGCFVYDSSGLPKRSDSSTGRMNGALIT
ncbi:unnamed protein product [Absidia cylindrospora]